MRRRSCNFTDGESSARGGAIERIVRAAASIGVRSIRLTGGEPLVRPRLADLVRSLAAIDGIDDIALSTNGLLLAEQVRELVAAGLRRVNVSLDTLRADRFETISRRPGFERVLAGVDAALEARLSPVKINCVVMRGRNDDELEGFARMTRERPVFVRFIEMMPVLENAGEQRDAYVPASEILERLRAFGDLRPDDGPGGNGPARYFRYPGAAGAVGVISPLSHDDCERCNRVGLPRAAVCGCACSAITKSICERRSVRARVATKPPRSFAAACSSNPSATTCDSANRRAGCAHFRRSAASVRHRLPGITSERRL